MNYLTRILRTSDRRKSQSKKKSNRVLQFEVMEKRYAFAADLVNIGLGFGESQHLDHYDGSGFVLETLPSVTIQTADPANPENTLSTSTPTALLDTFRLHSNPGASKRIYLDFDGHVTSGTIWNSNYTGGQNIVTPAFDLDGNTTAFSDAERERIQLIWERVSEDYIPFNVDVTTEDPGAAALTNSGGSDSEWGIRIVIGGSSYDWWGAGNGGLAYVGSFNWSSDTPGFVFPANLGGGAEKYTAEAISHETGHALGLNHDGRTSPVEEYYTGQGSGVTGWAPIMGNSYYQNVTQWSKGEYTSASNTYEDDLSIISTQNGFTYRTDDHGNTNSTAGMLNVSGAQISDWGIIERTTDVDAFTFTTDAGTIQINVSPLDRGPNLDVFLELYDMANILVASSNPIDLLSASLTVAVTSQQYVLRVSGTGKGSAATDGYSKYASLGQYFISGTIIPTTNDFLGVSAGTASMVEGNASTTAYTFVVNRSGNTSGSTTVGYSVLGSGTNPANADDFAGGILPSGVVSFAAGETSKTITVLIAGETIVENNDSFALTLSNASGASVISGNSATGLIQNDDLAAVAGISVTPTSGLSTSESKTKASFTVVLKSQPTADVTIAVTSRDITEGTVSTSLLRFTSTNWNIAQTVTVTGVDDTIRDGNITYLIDLASAQSSDPNYNGMQVADVQVTNQDNEKGKIVAGGMALGAEDTMDSIDHLMSQLSNSKATGSSSERTSNAVVQENRELTRGRMQNSFVRTVSGIDRSNPLQIANRDVSQVDMNTKSNRIDLAALDDAFSKLESQLNSLFS